MCTSNYTMLQVNYINNAEKNSDDKIYKYWWFDSMYMCYGEYLLRKYYK